MSAYRSVSQVIITSDISEHNIACIDSDSENVGIPGDIDTSIKETVESVPLAKHEKTVTTLGFEAISAPPLISRILF